MGRKHVRITDIRGQEEERRKGSLLQAARIYTISHRTYINLSVRLGQTVFQIIKVHLGRS